MHGEFRVRGGVARPWGLRGWASEIHQGSRHSGGSFPENPLPAPPLGWNCVPPPVHCSNTAKYDLPVSRRRTASCSCPYSAFLRIMTSPIPGVREKRYYRVRSRLRCTRILTGVFQDGDSIFCQHKIRAEFERRNAKARLGAGRAGEMRGSFGGGKRLPVTSKRFGNFPS